MKKKIVKTNKGLLRFLSKTKSGKFAKIEKSSLRYSRISDNTFTLTSSTENHFSLG